MHTQIDQPATQKRQTAQTKPMERKKNIYTRYIKLILHLSFNFSLFLFFFPRAVTLAYLAYINSFVRSFGCSLCVELCFLFSSFFFYLSLLFLSLTFSVRRRCRRRSSFCSFLLLYACFFFSSHVFSFSFFTFRFVSVAHIHRHKALNTDRFISFFYTHSQSLQYKWFSTRALFITSQNICPRPAIVKLIVVLCILILNLANLITQFTHRLEELLCK